MRADLHIHTTSSDGIYTPTEVVGWAKRNALDVIAITDHDSVSGLCEAIGEGEKQGIKVLPGIEVSSYSSCEIHILGYNFDYLNPDFVQELEKIKDMRKERNGVILDRLRALGITLPFTADMDGIGRLHMAKEMTKMGYARDVNDAFERYLGPNGKVYAEIRRTTPIEAVRLIKRYGGIASLAHPKKYLLNHNLDILVDGLKRFGLDAIETDYPRHTPQDTTDLVAIAKRYGLFRTGGSDFHDEDKDFIVQLDERTQDALKIK